MEDGLSSGERVLDLESRLSRVLEVGFRDESDEEGEERRGRS